MKQCVGCGYCCIKTTCPLGQKCFGVKPDILCPALVWDGGRYRCDVYEFDLWKKQFGIGCNSPLNTWRREVKQRTCYYCGQRSDELRKSDEDKLACPNCDRQIAKIYNDGYA